VKLTLTIALVLAFLLPHIASAHNRPGPHNARHAINHYWCGNANYYCDAGDAAWQVAGCETGYTYSPWAQNGQYLGLFQMGSWERNTFGHGNNVWDQARAAHRYYRVSGWGPWECQP
jgi:hypothetical protein